MDASSASNSEYISILIGGPEGTVVLGLDAPIYHLRIGYTRKANVDCPKLFGEHDVTFWRYEPLSNQRVSFMIADFHQTHKQN